jgi:hypothetical protein
MNTIPFFGKLSMNGFQISSVEITILNCIPNNTPVQLHQGIFLDEEDNQIITDGEELINNKWQLWLWLHETENLLYCEFSIPGGCTWRLFKNQLTLKCNHKPTLHFWVNEIFKRLGIPKENAFKSLSESQGEARILVDLEFSRLQMC